MTLDATSLADASRTASLPHVIRFVPVTSSTNDDVKALAREGAPHGTAVVADAQSAGRGRLGRTWVSPPGTALYLSVLVRPIGLPIARVPLLALATAVGVGEACGAPYRIKWPNDVLDPLGRKVAGILCELESAVPCAAVIGVGVNVLAAPPVEGAGFLAQDGIERDRSLFAAAVVRRILDVVRDLTRDPAPVLDRWRARSATLGARVRTGGKEGVAVALDPDGALVLESDGKRIRVLAGDVDPI
jgi:BirA family biotin operon repressor/biotin-[acetyl-CoA-carboxylase] ligase